MKTKKQTKTTQTNIPIFSYKAAVFIKKSEFIAYFKIDGFVFSKIVHLQVFFKLRQFIFS